jgi:hypothetical protein
MCYVVIGWELIGSELFYFSSVEFHLVDVRYYSSCLMLCSLSSLNYILLILSSVFFLLGGLVFWVIFYITHTCLFCDCLCSFS